jgi:hypothetical protein
MPHHRAIALVQSQREMFNELNRAAARCAAANFNERVTGLE